MDGWSLSVLALIHFVVIEAESSEAVGSWERREDTWGKAVRLWDVVVGTGEAGSAAIDVSVGNVQVKVVSEGRPVVRVVVNGKSVVYDVVLLLEIYL